MKTFQNQFLKLIDLRVDTDYESTDETIRQNVNFKSANAWTLVFAIFIASVGLNVNSTAVIIGAMLISPLMGPIVGAGYALGINDFELLKNSGRNLLYAVCISLFTSTIYFLISPFSEVQNEILARTSPNFYDVMIAIFGGAAGIVAISRSEKSNAIPGVAIATALMPPLCTAGFGLASLKWKFFVGALYLFVINSVFICLSTYLFVRYLNFDKVSYDNQKDQKRIRRWIIGVSISVAVPSLITFWILLNESAFRLRAGQFVDEIKFKSSYLVDKKFIFDFKTSVIRLTFIGPKLPSELVKQLEENKKYYGLQNTKLEIEQVTLDQSKNDKVGQLVQKDLIYKQQITNLETEIKSMKQKELLPKSLLSEVSIFSPLVEKIFFQDEDVQIVWKRLPSTNQKKTVEEFLKVRLKSTFNFFHSHNLK